MQLLKVGKPSSGYDLMFAVTQSEYSCLNTRDVSAVLHSHPIPSEAYPVQVGIEEKFTSHVSGSKKRKGNPNDGFSQRCCRITVNIYIYAYMHISCAFVFMTVGTQRVRDWIQDFYSAVTKLCDDESDAIAAAAFSAIGAPVRAHPLCSTSVDVELRSYRGAEGGASRKSSWGGGYSSAESQDGCISHKQVCIFVSLCVA